MIPRQKNCNSHGTSSTGDFKFNACVYTYIHTETLRRYVNGLQFHTRLSEILNFFLVGLPIKTVLVCVCDSCYFSECAVRVYNVMRHYGSTVLLPLRRLPSQIAAGRGAIPVAHSRLLRGASSSCWPWVAAHSSDYKVCVSVSIPAVSGHKCWCVHC